MLQMTDFVQLIHGIYFFFFCITVLVYEQISPGGEHLVNRVYLWYMATQLTEEQEEIVLLVVVTA